MELGNLEVYSVVNIDGVDYIKVPDGSWVSYSISDDAFNEGVKGGCKVIKRGRGRPRKIKPNKKIIVTM
jgi:hypothetical protein